MQQAAEARNSDANAADLKTPVACMKVRGHGHWGLTSVFLFSQLQLCMGAS
jgi:hypothetical protein